MSKNRKAWNEAMKAMGAKVPAAAGKGSRRASSRISSVSKDLRVVDDETREHVRNARLDALEADNYAEEHVEKDDAYSDEDEDGGGTGKKARKRQKKAPKQGGAEAVSRWRKKKYKGLLQVVFEEGYTTAAGAVNYTTAAMGPSRLPPRAFCSVCGYFGTFKCPRCGLRYCSRRCMDAHKETRCLKFGT